MLMILIMWCGLSSIANKRIHIGTTVKDFRARSFIEWDLQDQYYAELDKHGSYKMDLQLMFRTRRESGLLFKAHNAQKSEYIILEVNESPFASVDF